MSNTYGISNDHLGFVVDHFQGGRAICFTLYRSDLGISASNKDAICNQSFDSILDFINELDANGSIKLKNIIHLLPTHGVHQCSFRDIATWRSKVFNLVDGKLDSGWTMFLIFGPEHMDTVMALRLMQDQFVELVGTSRLRIKFLELEYLTNY